MAKAEWFEWGGTGKIDITHWEFFTYDRQGISDGVSEVFDEEPPEVDFVFHDGNVHVAVGLPLGSEMGQTVYWRADLRKIISEQIEFLPAETRTFLATALRSIADEIEASNVPCPDVD